MTVLRLGHYVEDPDTQALYIIYSMRYQHAQLIETNTEGNPITTTPTHELPLTIIHTYNHYSAWPPRPRGRPHGTTHGRPHNQNIRTRLERRMEQGDSLAQALVNTNTTPQAGFTALKLMAPNALPPILVSMRDFVLVMQSARPKPCRILIAASH